MERSLRDLKEEVEGSLTGSYVYRNSSRDTPKQDPGMPNDTPHARELLATIEAQAAKDDNFKQKVLDLLSTEPENSFQDVGDFGDSQGDESV